MSKTVTELLASGLIRGPEDMARHIAIMQATQAGMRLDDFSELVASVAPDMVPELLTTQVEARLLREFNKWPKDWEKWISTESPHYLSTQYIERVAQMRKIADLADTGGRYAEIGQPETTELSYEIGGFGNLYGVDFRTLRSDRLGYFKKLGEILGTAAASRLHEYIYVTNLQANPTLTEDATALFDETDHANDADNAGTGNDLNYANFRTAWRLGRKAIDASSEPLGSRKGILICGSHWEDIAYELAENSFRVGTANPNDRNQMKRYIAGVDVSDKLGYDWYIAFLDIAGFEMSFLDGQKTPKFEKEFEQSSYNFETDKTRFKVSQFYGGIHSRAIAFVRGSANALAA